MRTLIPCLLLVACDGGKQSPAPAPSPAAPAPVVAHDATAAPSPCTEALTRWQDLEKFDFDPENRVEPTLYAATQLLSGPNVMDVCTDEQLASALAASMQRIQDSLIVVDRSGSDGPVILGRHRAIEILKAISGRDFGMLHASHPNQPAGFRLGPVARQMLDVEDEITVVGWRGWWSNVSSNPRAAITLGRSSKSSGTAPPPFDFDPATAAQLAELKKKRDKLVAEEPADTARAQSARDRELDEARARARKNRARYPISKECAENPLAKGCM